MSDKNLPDGVDANLLAGIDRLAPYLQKKKSQTGQDWTDVYQIDYPQNVGVAFRVFSSSKGSLTVQLNTVPGGGYLFLASSEHKLPVMNLDFANDVRDEAVQIMHRTIAYGLERHGISFLPVSWTASSQIDGSIYKQTLIDRVDMDAVFHNPQKEYFLTGYDQNETPPLYFLARLPHAVDSVKEALEALKPESVKKAEQMDIPVFRQGDMFAIRTPYTTSDLRRMDATISDQVEWKTKEYIGKPVPQCECADCKRMYDIYLEMQPDDSGYVTKKHIRKRGLYGTAHTATELAFLPDGTMFARGEIIHDPRGVRNEGRRPDHDPLRLPGKKWYLVVRNTVPVTPGPRQSHRQ